MKINSYLCNFKSEKGMTTIVKYICCVLLTVCALGWAQRQEKPVTPRETVPQEVYTGCIQAKESAAAKTIAHLYTEQTAVPVQAAAKGPGNSTHHFKPKCLSAAIGSHRPNLRIYETGDASPLPLLPHFYTIDYYIYTLEHILI